MNTREKLWAVIIVAAFGFIWLFARALGDSLGELIVETVCAVFVAILVGAAFGLALDALRLKTDVAINVGLVIAGIMLLSHFTVSAKLAPAKWAFKHAVDKGDHAAIGDTIAMRDEIIRRSSAFLVGEGFKYDIDTEYLNTANVYIWFPFSGFFRKPHTTNGLGLAPEAISVC